MPVRSGATRMRRALSQCADAHSLISLCILVTHTLLPQCFALRRDRPPSALARCIRLRFHRPLAARPMPPAGAQKTPPVSRRGLVLRCCDLRGGGLVALGLGGGDCALERSPGHAELASGGRLWHAREDGVHGLLTRPLVGC